MNSGPVWRIGLLRDNAGVDMGRNIFQAKAPAAMIRAVRAVVHENESAQRAFDLYEHLQDAAETEEILQHT